ncbi:beta-galactosidase GalB [Galbibacter sp. PAP.153]|uniref:beta-galactosidase GalB n=1 Tax=Galbibacter sp. PAP.153 TaxID=3104623 RepID=UPI00300B3EAA
MYTRLITTLKNIALIIIALLFSCNETGKGQQNSSGTKQVRERISINNDWYFYKYPDEETPDTLIYDTRPSITEVNDNKPADAKPTKAVAQTSDVFVLKPWILPTGNDFIKDPAKRYDIPNGNPGENFPFVKKEFNDSSWQKIDLPHDWAIQGPFMQGWEAKVGGGMGRLPSPGVAWYRKKINIPESDIGKTIFLDIDGAMSYAMVWCNGHIVGGWPYGYSSWRVELTSYLKPGQENQLAIRLDNPNYSSRWYPGGGIYRNVWLVKTNPVHIAHWGTFVRTPQVTKDSALVAIEANVENDSNETISLQVSTEIYLKQGNKKIASINGKAVQLKPNQTLKYLDSVVIKNPKLWGPPPTQTPNLYIAKTYVKKDGKIIDNYETPFGIRSVEFIAKEGMLINGEKVFIKGVNQHHDLGPLGAAFNERAAQRQLETLRETGVNAIRMAHNPPATELLELTDSMGFVVIDELFDMWERKKNPHDFHLIFNDWYEQDLRAWVRRDRNHPSVVLWSTGNEVGEQYTGHAGAAVAAKVNKIVRQEDPTRLTMASMNYAKPDMPFSAEMDIINLNYQGEGIRNAPEYAHLKGINTPPLYPAFHEKFPTKVIISSENAATFSSRGSYTFPVTKGISSPLAEALGGIEKLGIVSDYNLYSADFGSSPDKVFASIDKHPYVAGGFVWSGWDYLGEPTPYYLSRSSYYGIIDLAGFKKDRFYLYQSRWRPDYPMAHILPHWNWPDRMGKVTLVHVFTSGDEAELFLNGKSLGRKKKEKYQYRLRWNDVKYQPGELRVIAYKHNKKWAEDIVKTSGEAYKLNAKVDRDTIIANGTDIVFIEVQVEDKQGNFVPDANPEIEFQLEGKGILVATANGDPTNMVSFNSKKREAFNGKILTIVKATGSGEIKVTIKSKGMEPDAVQLHAN